MEIVALLSHYGLSAYSKSDISHLLSEKRAGEGNRTLVSCSALSPTQKEDSLTSDYISARAFLTGKEALLAPLCSEIDRHFEPLGGDILTHKTAAFGCYSGCVCGGGLLTALRSIRAVIAKEI